VASKLIVWVIQGLGGDETFGAGKKVSGKKVSKKVSEVSWITKKVSEVSWITVSPLHPEAVESQLLALFPSYAARTGRFLGTPLAHLRQPSHQ
jgi:hypothetical protein